MASDKFVFKSVSFSPSQPEGLRIIARDTPKVRRQETKTWRPAQGASRTHPPAAAVGATVPGWTPCLPPASHAPGQTESQGAFRADSRLQKATRFLQPQGATHKRGPPMPPTAPRWQGGQRWPRSGAANGRPGPAWAPVASLPFCRLPGRCPAPAAREAGAPGRGAALGSPSPLHVWRTVEWQGNP